jgi:hypothetical protein
VCGDVSSNTYKKRPARLDGGLSDDSGSAQRREQATTPKHHARAQGSYTSVAVGVFDRQPTKGSTRSR